MVSLILGVSLASAAGFHTELRWTSSYGPDAYGALRLVAEADPGLELGTLLVGGTRSGLYGLGARSVRLGEGLVARGELRLGMVEEEGAKAGLLLGLRVEAGPVVAALDGGYTGGLGWQGAGGVDAPIAERWTLSPRLRLETWAGDRDLALRAALGLRHQAASGLWVAAEASAGGRDVFHLGPGFALSVGVAP